MFTLPADITAVSDNDLNELNSNVRAHIRGLLGADNAGGSPEDLATARDAYHAITAERENRAQAAQLRADLAAAVADPVVPDADPDPAPEGDGDVDGEGDGGAIVASRGRSGGTRPTIEQGTPTTAADRYVAMSTATDVPGFGSGVELNDFGRAVQALSNRLETYSGSRSGRSNRTRKIGQHKYVIPSKTAIRHGGVMFRRNYPDDLRFTEGADTLELLKHAADEKRLPGGSLIKSAEALVKSGRSLTAAVGWCAPSETIYDLCELSSLDGILDLPEVEASRGGFYVPANGGPDFSILWNGLGDEGDVILSEYDVENDAEKICFEIPCPDFTEVRLDVAYRCLTGGLLQRRGYPEVIAWFARESMKALGHKVNQSVIQKIVAASGSVNVIPAIPGSDDAASSLLSAVALAVEDLRYRHRMSRTRTLEVVLPFWVIEQIRAALARRRGVYALEVTDAEILRFFTARNAVPRFVYDWQDAFTGLVTGPGGATPLTALPTTVDFVVYPAGTFTKIVRDVVNLDTIYDNAMLTQNQYTAIFAEDGFNVIKTCPASRNYRVTVDPAGIVGCCDLES